MFRYLFGLSFLVMLSSCQKGGGYRDRAMITDAQRNIRSVRNALEEYWVDHGSYPEEDVTLKDALHPYFLRVKIREKDDVPLHIATIDNARNQLDNTSSMLGNVKRQVVPLLDSIKKAEFVSALNKIDGIISAYRVEIEGGESCIDNVSMQECETAISIAKKMEPEAAILEMENELMAKCDEVVKAMDLLTSNIEAGALDSLEKSLLEEKIGGIIGTFKVYKKILAEEKIEDAQVVIPEEEITGIESIIGIPDSTTVLLIENVKIKLGDYRRLELDKGNMTSLITNIQTLERAKSLFFNYERTIRNGVRKSAKIVLANGTLHKIAEALEDYRREKGSYPARDVTLEPIIHLYFIEVTMGGDTIDRYEEKLSYLKEFPSYSVTRDGFEVRARVNDEVCTPIFCRTEIVSDWDGVVSAFAEGPTYRTENPKLTYFLTARARDSKRTIVCDRPPVRRAEK